MKKSLILITFCFFVFCSCNNKQKSRELYEYDAPVMIDDSCDTQVDSADSRNVETTDAKEAKQVRSLPSTSSTNRNKKNNYDNMRGFDPASEDDTEDNGLSRYMENNDDEGWD